MKNRDLMFDCSYMDGMLKSHQTESIEVRDLKAQCFDMLSKMEQRTTTENNREKIWIDQMEGLLKIKTLTATFSDKLVYLVGC